MVLKIIFILCIIWLLFTENNIINNTTDIIHENYNTHELSDNIYENYNTLELTDNYIYTEQEIINLFKNNDIIQISIPANRIARIDYRGDKTIKFSGGKHIIHKYIDDKMIYQINIIPNYYLINNTNVIPVRDRELHYFPRYNQYESKYIKHKLLNNLTNSKKSAKVNQCSRNCNK
jgi:hypothetical protein